MLATVFKNKKYIPATEEIIGSDKFVGTQITNVTASDDFPECFDICFNVLNTCNTSCCY